MSDYFPMVEGNATSINNAMNTLDEKQREFVIRQVPATNGLVLAIIQGYVYSTDLTPDGYNALIAMAVLIEKVKDGSIKE